MYDDDEPAIAQYSDSSTGGGIVVLVIVILIGWWGYNHFIKTDYSKPWFKGEALVHVCKVPYYSLSDCYLTSVTSDGTEIIQINFSNGGYLVNQGGECYEAAADPTFNNDKRVCTLNDDDGNRWDIAP